MRVFISSTVYDLIDIRAEVAKKLMELGIDPVLSDDTTSDFKAVPNTNSIESCLINLESCDEVILILDKRYGPSLAGAGFEDVSATHLEYKRAVELKKPIHVFARDKLVADLTIWKKNGRKKVNLVWVTPENHGLLDLLDQHSKLKEDNSSNWYSTFRDSIQLKAAVTKLFEPKLLPARLTEALQTNSFPLITYDLDCDIDKGPSKNLLKTTLTLKNVGGAPAFDFKLQEQNAEAHSAENQVLAPGQTTSTGAIVIENGNNTTKINLIYTLEYNSAIGISVRELLLVNVCISNGLIVSSCKGSNHQYLQSENWEPIIVEEEN